jgi:hypothetical protein
MFVQAANENSCEFPFAILIPSIQEELSKRIGHLESSMVGQAANLSPSQVDKVSWPMRRMGHLESSMVGQTANLSPGQVDKVSWPMRRMDHLESSIGPAAPGSEASSHLSYDGVLLDRVYPSSQAPRATNR